MHQRINALFSISPKIAKKQATVSPVPESSTAENNRSTRIVQHPKSFLNSTRHRGASHIASRASFDRH